MDSSSSSKTKLNNNNNSISNSTTTTTTVTPCSNNPNYILLDRIFRLQKYNLSSLLMPTTPTSSSSNIQQQQQQQQPTAINIQNTTNYLNEILNCLNELLTKFQSKAYQSPPPPSSNTTNTTNNSNTQPQSTNNSNNITTIILPTDIIIKILVKLCQVIPNDINYHKIPIYASPINLSLIQLPLKFAQLIVLISRYQNSISFNENSTELEILVNFFLYIIKLDKSTTTSSSTTVSSSSTASNNKPSSFNNIVNTNLRIESLKALSSLLHNNGPNINSKLQQPLIECLLDLSNYSDLSIDQETKRIATVSLGNLCMQCGTKLSKYYIQIFDRLHSNLERVTTQINNDKYLIKFTSSILRSLQLLISQAKGILDQKSKSLYNILKTLMFYGVNISSSMSSVLTYQYQFEFSSRRKKQQLNSSNGSNGNGGSNGITNTSPAIVTSASLNNNETNNNNSEIEKSTGITSSDSDIDERYNLSKLRFLTITLLNTMVKHSPKVFFGYWSLFLPSTPFPLTPTVFTSMTNDPDIKIKIVAANFLQTIIDGSKDFLVAVNNNNNNNNSSSGSGSSNNNNNGSLAMNKLNLNDTTASSSSLATSTNSFTTFSQNLTSILKEIHNGLIMLLVQDPNYILPSFHHQILKCVSSLIVNSPYERLNNPKLLSSLLTSISPYIQHRDHSIQLTSLICIKQLFDLTPLSPIQLLPILNNNSNILNTILGFLENNNNNDNNNDNNNNSILPALPNPSLINESKDSSNSNSNSSNSNNNNSNTPFHFNHNEYVKIECIQIFGALTKHNFIVFLDYADRVYNILFLILKKEILIHNSNSNGNNSNNSSGNVNSNSNGIGGNSGNTSSSSSNGLNESSIANYCLKTFEEITKVINDYHKKDEQFNYEIVEKKFWNLFFIILPSLTIDPYPQIRGSICNIFSNISSKQFETSMTKTQQMHLVSVVLGLIFDEQHIVRASACRSVGILIKIESLHDDATFLSNAASCLTKSMGDVNINVKIKACWSLANLCDHLVSLKSNQEVLFNDIPQQILSKVLESLLNSSFDNPKIRSNVVRALGNFARFADKNVLYNINETSTFCKILESSSSSSSSNSSSNSNNNNAFASVNYYGSSIGSNSSSGSGGSIIDGHHHHHQQILLEEEEEKEEIIIENKQKQSLPPQMANSITLKKDAIILDRIVDSLLKNAQEPSSSFNFVKVKWNSCYALGNLFYNQDIEFPSDEFYSGTGGGNENDKRIEKENDKWLPQVYSTLISLMKSCKNFKTRINATASLATPTHSRRKYGLFFRDCLEAILESLSNINTITDTSEFQYRDNLEKQLEIALIHMISEMKISEVKQFDQLFFQRADIIINSFQKHQIILPTSPTTITAATPPQTPPHPLVSSTPSSTPMVSSSSSSLNNNTTTTTTSSSSSTTERPTTKEYQKALEIIKTFCQNQTNTENMDDTKKLQLSQLCLLYDFSESNYQEMYSKLQEVHSTGTSSH